jgi:hypothetical protein
MTMRVFRRSVGGGPSLTSYEFTAPDHDFDLNIKFPSGRVVRKDKTCSIKSS